VGSESVKTIVIIDDKDHALKQIMYEFSGISKSNLVFRHFDTIKAFRAAEMDSAFIIFLDFFLSKDRDYGSSLIPELKCEHLICFSSKKKMSDHMRDLAQNGNYKNIRNVYSVKKLKKSIENVELNEILEKIFGGRKTVENIE